MIVPVIEELADPNRGFGEMRSRMILLNVIEFIGIKKPAYLAINGF